MSGPKAILDDEWSIAATMPPFEPAAAATEFQGRDDDDFDDGIEYGVFLWPLGCLVAILAASLVAVLV